MSKSKNGIAWEKIFEKYLILDKIASDGRFSISSSDINEFREVCLMTKFGHKSRLRKLFSENKLSILLTSIDTSETGLFETFYDYNKEDIKVTPIHFSLYLESSDYKDITSKARAINCTSVSKILHRRVICLRRFSIPLRSNSRNLAAYNSYPLYINS